MKRVRVIGEVSLLMRAFGAVVVIWGEIRWEGKGA